MDDIWQVGGNTVVSAYTMYRHLQHKAILWMTFDRWEQLL